VSRAPAAGPSALHRIEAGTYRSADERFTVQQASGRWLVTDEAQLDELGLPLVRGPFGTLGAARESIATARTGPAPTSELTHRIATPRQGRRRAGRPAAPPQREPEPEPIEIRRYRSGDGPTLRAFWAGVGMRSLGDDDIGLDLLAGRNPGLVLVAVRGDRVVGTALGGWDGRRGWLYHVAVADPERRAGLGRRLVHEVERKLRALGCPKVNVIVRDDNGEGLDFWRALGYDAAPARQLGREL